MSTRRSMTSNTQFNRISLISWRISTQWGPLLPKEGGMIQVDIGGHPPIPFGPAPSILAGFQIQHNLLFLVGFSGPELPKQHGSMDQCFSFKICTPRIDISNELFHASNGGRMPKLRPREVEPPIYPNGARSFGTSSPRVRFLEFQRSVAITSLLIDSLPAP